MATIYFDMDGTIADLYSVDGWLDSLIAEDTKPYADAEPMVNCAEFCKCASALIALGYTLGVISWGSKNGSKDYTKRVKRTKVEWLRKHFGDVFSEIHVVKYGTPKYSVAKDKSGILFDDEEQNRVAWQGQAYTHDELMDKLREMCG